MTDEEKSTLTPRGLGTLLKQIFLLLLCTGLFALVLHLYKAPAEAALYAGLLCMCLLLGVGAIEGLRLRQRQQELRRLQKALPDSLQLLPPAHRPLEEEYQQLLRQMAAAHALQVTQEDIRYQQMAEYIALWGHQIKTPLAAQRLLLSKDDSPQGRALGAEVFQVERYVDMALNYIKLEAGADDFRFTLVNLKEAAHEAVRRYARHFVLKKLSLAVQVPGEAQVSTDRKQLLFVLEQLISNGIKYTTTGGLSIAWQEESRTLTIQDTGCGIRPEDIPLLTHQGFTGYNGHIDRQATGLGLYLAGRVCSRLGIALAFDSLWGEGTTVKLTFAEHLQPM